MIPEGEDGVTHINIYSKGRTKLGRLLSNWSPSPDRAMIHTKDGNFKTIEGYWAWLCYPCDDMYTAGGWEAKQHIQRTKKVRSHCADFEDRIRFAIRNKIELSPMLRSLVVSSVLPFVHYYVYGDKRVNAGHSWIVEYIEEIRDNLKEEFGAD